MSNLEALLVEYSYRGSEESVVNDTIRLFEAEVGGERKPYAMRLGAIDLVTFLEIVVSFVAGVAITPVLSKYFEGLLGADGLKKLGEEHRMAINGWFSKLESDFEKLLTALKNLLKAGPPRFIFKKKEKALALRIRLGYAECFIVLNHSSMDPTLFHRLPQAIARLLRYVAEYGLPDDAHVLQLYFDGKTKDWKYLFMPTSSGFGRWIDRYVDLETSETVHVRSQSEFNKTFGPSYEDEWKFLVGPFRPQDEF